MFMKKKANDWFRMPKTGEKKKLRDHWISKNKYYYRQEVNYLKFLIPPKKRVIEFGCANGFILSALSPSYGVGVDTNQDFINEGKQKYPGINFYCIDVEKDNSASVFSEKFDFVLISNALGFFKDCQKTLGLLKKCCHPDTRIIITYHNCLWDPILSLLEKFGLKMKTGTHNYLSTDDIHNLLFLSGYDFIKQDYRQLIPKSFFGIGDFINKFVATLPFIRKLCLRNYVIARISEEQKAPMSVSVIVTCRNEEGNIENAIKRLPHFTDNIEVIFVEGGSRDNTLEEIHRVKDKYKEKDIKVYQQTGKGKADAVRLGFEKASNEILMILDGDLTTPPEDLPKFYDIIVSGKGEYVHGTRLVYPMDKEAMQYLNYLGNRFFSRIFTFLLNQMFTDTLCGTKVLTKKNYIRLEENRHYFGNFDPFGDFDLIFGISKLNLQAVEVPVRYAARTYGSTNISRFSHGWLLIKMVLYAYKKLKMV